MEVKVHEVNTHYQLIGKKGPLICLLHGWGGDWQSWHPLIPELSKHYRLLIPDLPAFGHSATPDYVWTSQDYADWLGEFLEALADGKALRLIGHSFGAKIAAIYAGRQPAKLDRLVLIAAAGQPDPVSWRVKLSSELSRLLPASAKEQLPASFKRRLLEKLGSATDHLLSTPVQRQILRRVIHEDIAESLVHINCPTLLLWGADDQDTPLQQASRFERAIEGAELEIIPGAGHFVFVDAPEKSLKKIEGFLS